MSSFQYGGGRTPMGKCDRLMPLNVKIPSARDDPTANASATLVAASGSTPQSSTDNNATKKKTTGISSSNNKSADSQTNVNIATRTYPISTLLSSMTPPRAATAGGLFAGGGGGKERTPFSQRLGAAGAGDGRTDVIAGARREETPPSVGTESFDDRSRSPPAGDGSTGPKSHTKSTAEKGREDGSFLKAGGAGAASYFAGIYDPASVMSLGGTKALTAALGNKTAAAGAGGGNSPSAATSSHAENKEAGMLLAALVATDAQRAKAVEVYQEQVVQFLSSEVSTMVADLFLVQSEIDVHYFQISRVLDKGERARKAAIAAGMAAAAARKTRGATGGGSNSPSASGGSPTSSPAGRGTDKDDEDEGTHEAFKALLKFKAKGITELKTAIRLILQSTSPSALVSSGTQAMRSLLASDITEQNQMADGSYAYRQRSQAHAQYYEAPAKPTTTAAKKAGDIGGVSAAGSNDLAFSSFSSSSPSRAGGGEGTASVYNQPPSHHQMSVHAAQSAAVAKANHYNPYNFSAKTLAHLSKASSFILNAKVRVGANLAGAGGSGAAEDTGAAAGFAATSVGVNMMMAAGGKAQPSSSQQQRGLAVDDPQVEPSGSFGAFSDVNNMRGTPITASSPSSAAGAGGAGKVATKDSVVSSGGGGTLWIDEASHTTPTAAGGPPPNLSSVALPPPSELTPITLIHLQKLLLQKVNELIRVAHVAASLGIVAKAGLPSYLKPMLFGAGIAGFEAAHQPSPTTTTTTTTSGNKSPSYSSSNTGGGGLDGATAVGSRATAATAAAAANAAAAFYGSGTSSPSAGGLNANAVAAAHHHHTHYGGQQQQLHNNGTVSLASLTSAATSSHNPRPLLGRGASSRGLNQQQQQQQQPSYFVGLNQATGVVSSSFSQFPPPHSTAHYWGGQQQGGIASVVKELLPTHHTQTVCHPLVLSTPLLVPYPFSPACTNAALVGTGCGSSEALLPSHNGKGNSLQLQQRSASAGPTRVEERRAPAGSSSTPSNNNLSAEALPTSGAGGGITAAAQREQPNNNVFAEPTETDDPVTSAVAGASARQAFPTVGIDAAAVIRRCQFAVRDIMNTTEFFPSLSLSSPQRQQQQQHQSKRGSLAPSAASSPSQQPFIMPVGPTGHRLAVPPSPYAVDITIPLASNVTDAVMIYHSPAPTPKQPDALFADEEILAAAAAAGVVLPSALLEHQQRKMLLAAAQQQSNANKFSAITTQLTPFQGGASSSGAYDPPFLANVAATSSPATRRKLVGGSNSGDNAATRFILENQQASPAGGVVSVGRIGAPPRAQSASLISSSEKKKILPLPAPKSSGLGHKLITASTALVDKRTASAISGGARRQPPESRASTTRRAPERLAAETFDPEFEEAGEDTRRSKPSNREEKGEEDGFEDTDELDAETLTSVYEDTIGGGGSSRSSALALQRKSTSAKDPDAEFAVGGTHRRSDSRGGNNNDDDYYDDHYEVESADGRRDSSVSSSNDEFEKAAMERRRDFLEERRRRLIGPLPVSSFMARTSPLLITTNTSPDEETHDEEEEKISLSPTSFNSKAKRGAFNGIPSTSTSPSRASSAAKEAKSHPQQHRFQITSLPIKAHLSKNPVIDALVKKGVLPPRPTTSNAADGKGNSTTSSMARKGKPVASVNGSGESRPDYLNDRSRLVSPVISSASMADARTCVPNASNELPAIPPSGAGILLAPLPPPRIAPRPIERYEAPHSVKLSALEKALALKEKERKERSITNHHPLSPSEEEEEGNEYKLLIDTERDRHGTSVMRAQSPAFALGGGWHRSPSRGAVSRGSSGGRHQRVSNATQMQGDDVGGANEEASQPQHSGEEEDVSWVVAGGGPHRTVEGLNDDKPVAADHDGHRGSANDDNNAFDDETAPESFSIDTSRSRSARRAAAAVPETSRRVGGGPDARPPSNANNQKQTKSDQHQQFRISPSLPSGKEVYELKMRLHEAEVTVDELKADNYRLQQKLEIFSAVRDHLGAANEIGKFVELGSSVAAALFLQGLRRSGLSLRPPQAAQQQVGIGASKSSGKASPTHSPLVPSSSPSAGQSSTVAAIENKQGSTNAFNASAAASSNAESPLKAVGATGARTSSASAAGGAKPSRRLSSKGANGRQQQSELESTVSPLTIFTAPTLTLPLQQPLPPPTSQQIANQFFSAMVNDLARICGGDKVFTLYPPVTVSQQASSPTSTTATPSHHHHHGHGHAHPSANASNNALTPRAAAAGGNATDPNEFSHRSNGTDRDRDRAAAELAEVAPASARAAAVFGQVYAATEATVGTLGGNLGAGAAGSRKSNLGLAMAGTPPPQQGSQAGASINYAISAAGASKEVALALGSNTALMVVQANTPAATNPLQTATASAPSASALSAQNSRPMPYLYPTKLLLTQLLSECGLADPNPSADEPTTDGVPRPPQPSSAPPQEGGGNLSVSPLPTVDAVARILNYSGGAFAGLLAELPIGWVTNAMLSNAAAHAKLVKREEKQQGNTANNNGQQFTSLSMLSSRSSGSTMQHNSDVVTVSDPAIMTSGPGDLTPHTTRTSSGKGSRPSTSVVGVGSDAVANSGRAPIYIPTLPLSALTTTAEERFKMLEKLVVFGVHQQQQRDAQPQAEALSNVLPSTSSTTRPSAVSLIIPPSPATNVAQAALPIGLVSPPLEGAGGGGASNTKGASKRASSSASASTIPTFSRGERTAAHRPSGASEEASSFLIALSSNPIAPTAGGGGSGGRAFTTPPPPSFPSTASPSFSPTPAPQLSLKNSTPPINVEAILSSLQAALVASAAAGKKGGQRSGGNTSSSHSPSASLSSATGGKKGGGSTTNALVLDPLLLPPTDSEPDEHQIVRKVILEAVASQPHPLDALSPRTVKIAREVKDILVALGGSAENVANYVANNNTNGSYGVAVGGGGASIFTQQPPQNALQAAGGYISPPPPPIPLASTLTSGPTAAAAAAFGIGNGPSPNTVKNAAKTFVGLSSAQQEARVGEWISAYNNNPHLRNVVKIQNALIELLLTALLKGDGAEMPNMTL